MQINYLHNILSLDQIKLYTQATPKPLQNQYGLHMIMIKAKNYYIRISSILPNIYQETKIHLNNSHHKHHIKHFINKFSSKHKKLIQAHHYIYDSILNFIKTPINQRGYSYADTINIITHQPSRMDLLKSVCDYQYSQQIYKPNTYQNLTVNQLDDILVANNLHMHLGKSKLATKAYGIYDFQIQNNLLTIEISAIYPNLISIYYNNLNIPNINLKQYTHSPTEYDVSGEPASDYISHDVKQTLLRFIHTSILNRDYTNAMIDDAIRLYGASVDLQKSVHYNYNQQNKLINQKPNIAVVK